MVILSIHKLNKSNYKKIIIKEAYNLYTVLNYNKHNSFGKYYSSNKLFNKSHYFEFSYRSIIDLGISLNNSPYVTSLFKNNIL